jgi:hypothetical protein
MRVISRTYQRSFIGNDQWAAYLLYYQLSAGQKFYRQQGSRYPLIVAFGPGHLELVGRGTL